MLVLERQQNEAVIIDGPCRVVITKVRGDRIWLGFTADKSVRILREELVGKERREASDGRPHP